VDLPLAACTDGLLARLKSLLAMHPGPAPVVVRMVAGVDITKLRLGPEFHVLPAAGLLSELRSLLGAESVRIEVEGVQAPVPAGAV
jgi:hypothetical protein